jgi:hypothetical protein
VGGGMDRSGSYDRSYDRGPAGRQPGASMPSAPAPKPAFASRAPGLSKTFRPPRRSDEEAEPEANDTAKALGEKSLKSIDEKLVELIKNEIMEHNPNVQWDDVAGLQFAKDTIMEIVVWPMKHPELFTGLRAGFRGLLLFGPPGTGQMKKKKKRKKEKKMKEKRKKNFFFSLSPGPFFLSRCRQDTYWQVHREPVRLDLFLHLGLVSDFQVGRRGRKACASALCRGAGQSARGGLHRRGKRTP